MPEPDLTVVRERLERIGDTRATLEEHDRGIEELRLSRADLLARRDVLLGTGAVDRAAALDRRIADTDADLGRRRDRRVDLATEVGELSDGLVTLFSPEILTATLDGSHPVAMLPVRIETRFATSTRLRVRVFPDQLHVDAHDPALTLDERAAGEWYWQQRWPGLDDTAASSAAWRALASRFRPGRAAYVVTATTPTNQPADGDPAFPDVPTRESAWSRAPLATALPDRICVVGLARTADGWAERFRQWGSFVPDALAVGPDPRTLQQPAEEGGLPVDEGTRWLREPQAAQDNGVLIEVEHPSLAQGVERLVVLGVDWTQRPEQSAGSLATLLAAQRHAGHLGFVAQGTPTNNTSRTRSGFSTDPDVEAAALDPATPAVPGDAWSAGPRLAGALGVDAAAFAGLPGADLREHAWSSSLTDALWRATAGFYVTDLLDPLAKDDPQVDANLREFVREHVFASGPLPTLRVGAQPYGVVPVVSSRSYQPGAGQAEQLVHRVADLMRGIVTPALSAVPRLRRAGEEQDVDAVLLALLQRTPVPWTFRFRPLTGPVERKALSLYWERANSWQRTWTTAMWAGLHVTSSTRLNELTLGRDFPLNVPLVAKPGETDPTAYLAEIADLTADPHGRAALNLREDSAALLEALAACSAVLELDRCALATTRDRLQLTAEMLVALPALSNLAVPTPDSVRVEPPPAVALQALDFRSGRQLADAVIPAVSPTRPVGEFVTAELASRLGDLAALIGAPTDPLYWLGNHQVAVRELAQAPVDQLEWAFRGYLDLFSTRLDAWFTGLATARLADHRQAEPTGVHVGCWGVVEDLHRDVGAGAESLGFVHTPSLAHAASTALLRNGRLANRGEDGAVFDLQVTSDRVRRASWLLEGVAQGQSLAALLGYRLERGLRQAGLAMMRYQLPMRRTAPLRGPDVAPDEPVEVLVARDVVDGVALLDRWRQDPAAVLDAIDAQAEGAMPGTERTLLSRVIGSVFDSYDAVSDLLVAESVHQAALGNLERSGAALSAHDRHGRAPDLDYVGSPSSGHTVAHRVAVAVQGASLPGGWTRDARGAAEPLLDAWVGRLLGTPDRWEVGAVTLDAQGTSTVLTPMTLADLGIGPLSVALASQRPGQGRPSELEQRLGLAFAAQAAADPDVRLELLAEPSSPAAVGGLALLETIGGWVASVVAGSPLTAADLVPATDVRAGLASPGTIDVAELAVRVETTRTKLSAAASALQSASTDLQRSRALLGAVPFDGPDALPRVPVNHPQAGAELQAQVAEVAERLTALDAAVGTTVAEPLEHGDDATVARHIAVLHALLGPTQPVLPRFTLADRAPAAASLGARDDLLGEDPTFPAAWLQRAALVRPELDAFAGLMLHTEAAGGDVAAQLGLVQLPHRPGAPWLARPHGETGPPPHGSVGVVLHSWDPVDPARAMAGVLVDGWTETLPAEQETTAVTFHYDAPGAAAPQAVLLAVHPERNPGHWSFDLLLETVNEAVDLAQLRTLSAAELAPMGSFLPALYLPDDYTHDVPSVSLKDLVSRANAIGLGALFADVVGKA